MKIHHIICDFTISDNILAIADREASHFINKVIRIKNGETIAVCDGIQKKIFCEKKDDKLYVIRREEKVERSDMEICLSIIKGDNFEVACEKMTELGIKNITPLISDFSIKKSINHDRVNKIIKEATEQSEQFMKPKLGETQDFKDYILQNKKTKYILDQSGKEFTAFKKDSIVFIGPEGGWSENELDFAKTNGCQIIQISNNILRAETAATVAGFLVSR